MNVALRWLAVLAVGFPLVSARADDGPPPSPPPSAEAVLRLWSAWLQSSPHRGRLLGELAWRLATADDPRLRQPALALRLAEEARQHADPADGRPLEILAAAWAASGQFERAQTIAYRAWHLAEAAGDRTAQQRLAQQIAQYQQSLPLRRNFSQSAVALEGLRRNFSQSAVALEGLGQDLLGEGLVSEAFAAWEAAATAAPQWAALRAALGRRYFAQGDQPGTLEHAESALRLSPRDPALWALLGITYDRLGQRREARRCYEEALHLKPDWPQIRNNLAWILSTAPEDDLRDGARAVALLKPHCADPRTASATLWDTLSAAYAEAGRWDDARRAVDEALRCAQREDQPEMIPALQARRTWYAARRPLRDDRTSPTGAPPARNLDLVQLGREEFMAGNLRRAAQHWQAALRIRPDDPVSLNLLGKSEAAQGNHARAVALLARAARLRPGWATPLTNLAWLRALAIDPKLRDPEEAILLAETACDWAPDEPYPAYVRAVVYGAAGRFDEARRAAEAARELALHQRHGALQNQIEAAQRDFAAGKPHLPDLGPEKRAETSAADLARVQAELGMLALQQGRPEAAVQRLQAAVQQFPNDAALHNNLGQAYLQAGERSAALAEFRRVLANKPLWPDAANNLAWALATGPAPSPADIAEAIALAESLTSGEGADPAPLDTLAAAYAAARRFDDALACIDRALADPQLQHEPLLQRQLEQRRDRYAQGEPYRQSFKNVLACHPAYRSLQIRLGGVQAQAGRWADAQRHLHTALELGVDAAVLNDLGLIAQRQNHRDDARRLFIAAVQQAPDWLPAVNNLAWLLATRPDATADEADWAVQLAQRMCVQTQYRDPAVLDTLAVALAAAGRFNEAQQTAGRALQLAKTGERPDLATQLEERQALFAAGRRYTEE